jgi:hypothetical protein
MKPRTDSTLSTPASQPRGVNPTWVAVALPVQVGVLLMTWMAGLGWGGGLWHAAIAQAAVGIAVIVWLAARRHGPAVLVVPVVSVALAVGLSAVSNTVAVACNDRVLAAFEELPPPPGVSVETFASPSQGCMAKTRTGVDQEEVFDHYRNAFSKDGWRLVSDDEEGTLGERNGVYVHAYVTEGRVYFILGEE